MYIILWLVAVLFLLISSVQSFGITEDTLPPSGAMKRHRSFNRRDGFSRRDGLMIPFAMTTARRDVIHLLISGSVSGGLIMANPHVANAVTQAAASPDAVNVIASTLNTLLKRLDDIPVFCIVDKTTGANYMLVKQDQGMAIGYAFTTFAAALTVLSEAQKTAKEKNYFDVWQDATVTTIPMSIAVRLALKKRPRTTPKDQSLDSLIMMIPGADDRLDGMALDDRFKEQGRVPVFFVASEPQEATSDNPLQLYFTRKDLLRVWNEQHPGELPKVQALDLVTMFETVMRGQANVYLPTTNVKFVPPADALEAAKELKSRGILAPYSSTKMIV